MMFGQMYHHFHDDATHRRGQGSIDANTFSAVISDAISAGEILTPRGFATAVENGTLAPGQTCITFDDALLCQYDIAAPVMEVLGVRGFFFVYTSILGDNPDPLEFYRDFRNTQFDHIENFYAAFFDRIAKQFPALQKNLSQSFPEDYLSQFRFYSDNDRRFRFFRDHVAGPGLYREIMDDMLEAWGYDKIARAGELFMSPEHLRRLAAAGHEIGLHSHSHPTMIDALSPAEQIAEYSRNKTLLEDILEKPVWSMSHPCGRYNETTLRVLSQLGIKLGFRHSLHVTEIVSALEVPRENHSNLVKALVCKPAGAG